MDIKGLLNKKEVPIPLTLVKQDEWQRQEKVILPSTNEKKRRVAKHRRSTHPHQLQVLLRWYEKTQGYPEIREKEKIGKQLKWSYRRINKWFNNRRTKQRMETY